MNMPTPEQLSQYRSGWREHKRQKEQQLARRYSQALERARRAAVHLKENYGCKVTLFGSLLREDRFMEHSDIDIVFRIKRQYKFLEAVFRSNGHSGAL